MRSALIVMFEEDTVKSVEVPAVFVYVTGSFPKRTLFAPLPYLPNATPADASPAAVGVEPVTTIGPLLARMSVKFRSTPSLLALPELLAP
jgi:hypothetical protein